MNTLDSDEQLGTLAAAGERDAFLSLYERYVTPLYRFVYFRVPSKERAEDLVSEIFLKVWEKRAQYVHTKQGTYKAWLYTIARRHIIDWRRTERTHESLEHLSLPGEVPHHADPHVADTIHNALRTLTSDQQDVLTLRFWHDMTYEEIASVLGKSSASCRMHGSRAMAALKEVLPKELLVVLILIPHLI